MTSSPDADITSPSSPALTVSVSLYALPLLVGVAGNTALLHVILSHKTLRTAINAYIASMAVLDLLACTLLVPLRLLFYLALSNVHQSGPALCQAEVFFRSLVDAGRLLLLAAISFERYQAVANPFHRDKGTASRRAFVTLGVLWSAVMVYAALLTVFLKDTVMFEFCVKAAEGGGDDYRLWGGIEMYFVLPLSLVTVVMIVVCYVLMFRVLYAQRNKMMGHSKKAGGNKVAPIGGSVLHVKVKPNPVEVKAEPSGSVSVAKVTGVMTTATSVIPAADAVPSVTATPVIPAADAVPSVTATPVIPAADAVPSVTSHTVSSVNVLKCESGTEDNVSSLQHTEETVTEVLPPTVTPASEAKENIESSVSSSTNLHALVSTTTPPNPSVSNTLTPVNTSGSSTSFTVKTQSGERDHFQRTSQASVDSQGCLRSPRNELTVARTLEPSEPNSSAKEGRHTGCDDQCQPVIGDSQLSGRLLAAGDSSAVLVQLTDSDSAKAPGTLPSREYQTVEESSQHSGATTREKNMARLLPQGQQATPLPNTSPHSPSNTDRYLRVTSIQAGNTASPTVASLDKYSVNSTEKSPEAETLVVARTSVSAGDSENSHETQLSDLQAGAEVSGTSEAKSSPVGDPADKPTAAGAHSGPGQDTGHPVQVVKVVEAVQVVKVVEADGSEHVEQVSGSQNIQGDVCMFNPRNRMLGRRKMEGRVAKRLVVIFLTFLLLWLPYPSAVLVLHVLCMHPHPSPSSPVQQTVTDVIAVLSALSMVTAAVNPVFYGLANTTIRSVIFTALHNVCTCFRPCRLQSS